MSSCPFVWHFGGYHSEIFEGLKRVCFIKQEKSKHEKEETLITDRHTGYNLLFSRSVLVKTVWTLQKLTPLLQLTAWTPLQVLGACEHRCGSSSLGTKGIMAVLTIRELRGQLGKSLANCMGFPKEVMPPNFQVKRTKPLFLPAAKYTLSIRKYVFFCRHIV